MRRSNALTVLFLKDSSFLRRRSTLHHFKHLLRILCSDERFLIKRFAYAVIRPGYWACSFGGYLRNFQDVDGFRWDGLLDPRCDLLAWLTIAIEWQGSYGIARMITWLRLLRLIVFAVAVHQLSYRISENIALFHMHRTPRIVCPLGICFSLTSAPRFSLCLILEIGW